MSRLNIQYTYGEFSVEAQKLRPPLLRIKRVYSSKPILIDHAIINLLREN